MVADSGHASSPARSLADRLRDLREREYGSFTQTQLAKVLGGPGRKLSNATISQWENSDSGRLPPLQRLAAYARLFCTARSFASGAPCLLRDDELTEQERHWEEELYDELLQLREQAQSTVAAAPAPSTTGSRSSFWHFADGAAVSIVGSHAPDVPDYANPSNVNYSRYARYADLDALIEVYGQVKADNPASMIRLLTPEELVQDFALNHLIIIGGAAVYDPAPYFAKNIPLPSAWPIPETNTHFFICGSGEETCGFRSLRKDGILMQDVGVIARGPHPYIPERTVTLISGITSRGVHGAALCFTDSRVGASNEQYLTETFRTADAFCLVVRVPVRNNVALPPNLWRDEIRLYEWSTMTGARW
jgi:transcriptional regulator with XRE-family HTH domain